MQGYSDRINHAFAFAAKHHAPRAPEERAMAFVAHPANVAVILARHGADEITLVAGIVHHVLEVTPGRERPLLERAVAEKFGSVVLAIALDALEPLVDDRGEPIPWPVRKRDVLNGVLAMEPRALDICCADEIHQCGSAIALLERLGPEYLALNGHPDAHHALTWYGDLVEALGGRLDWPSRAMCVELGGLHRRLAAILGGRD